jgi:hypothetical protein
MSHPTEWTTAKDVPLNPTLQQFFHDGTRAYWDGYEPTATLAPTNSQRWHAFRVGWHSAQREAIREGLAHPLPD